MSLPAPTYQQFRELAHSQGWSIEYMARHTQASDPVKTAERILVHLAGSRWDDEPLPYPRLCQLYWEAMGSSAPAQPLAPAPISRASIAAQVAAQFRYARFTPEQSLQTQALMRAVDAAGDIICGMFRALAKREGWTTEEVLAHCRGYIDEPVRTATRVLVNDPADTVIPYMCLIDLYRKVMERRQRRPLGTAQAAPAPTYAQFRAVADSRGWTGEVLADECTDATTNLQALLATGPGRTRVKDKGLLAMYRLVTGPMTNVPAQASRGCKCGCGAKLRGKQQFATSACQRRVHRQKVARNS